MTKGVMTACYTMEDGTENSLREHYLDFQRIVHEEENIHKIDLIIELIRRMDYLLTYGLIDSSWEKPLRELETKILQMEPEEYNPNLLWYGFYFVGGKKEYIESQIKKQLPANVKYCMEETY